MKKNSTVRCLHFRNYKYIIWNHDNCRPVPVLVISVFHKKFKEIVWYSDGISILALVCMIFWRKGGKCFRVSVEIFLFLIWPKNVLGHWNLWKSQNSGIYLLYKNPWKQTIINKFTVLKCTNFHCNQICL